MKQGAPLRRTELKRGKPLRSKRKPKLPPEARVFKNWWIGQPCASCRFMPAQVTHHVVLEQYLKGRDKWSLENAMPLCHICHNDHHSANGLRVRRVRLTEDHLNFASRVLGGRAGSYFARRYA